MSRGDDSALGPCVDERAAMANALHPNAVVSIHADGGPRPGVVPRQLFGATAESGPGRTIGAVRPRHARPNAGFGIPPASYIGQDGLYGRSDLAGLNLAQYPSVLVECAT